MNVRLLIILLLLSCRSFVQVLAQPVNKNASPEARKLLQYIYDVSGRKLLSGQHNYNQQPDRFSDSARAITGKSPAVWGTDFIWNGLKDNGPAIVEESIRKHKQGHLITLMWHQGRPIDNPPYGWRESVQGKLTDDQWRELTTSGTELNKRWLAQIDKIAEYLKLLQVANVPVLWRPYHEMNGVWFWWGNRPGKNGIAKLWIMMYDRYTNYHKLNNLVWVWGANGPRDIPEDEAYPYAPFYPGARYVDILGTDIYHFDYEQKDYEELLKLARGKPIALTEVGELPKPEVLRAQPKWAWFLIWSSWLWTDNTRQRVRDVYGQPQTITLDEVRR